jgi:hypothetical protein
VLRGRRTRHGLWPESSKRVKWTVCFVLWAVAWAWYAVNSGEWTVCFAL